MELLLYLQVEHVECFRIRKNWIAADDFLLWEPFESDIHQQRLSYGYKKHLRSFSD